MFVHVISHLIATITSAVMTAGGGSTKMAE